MPFRGQHRSIRFARDVVNAVFVYDVLHVGVFLFGLVLGLDLGLAHSQLIHFLDRPPSDDVQGGYFQEEFREVLVLVHQAEDGGGDHLLLMVGGGVHLCLADGTFEVGYLEEVLPARFSLGGVGRGFHPGFLLLVSEDGRELRIGYLRLYLFDAACADAEGAVVVAVLDGAVDSALEDEAGVVFCEFDDGSEGIGVVVFELGAVVVDLVLEASGLFHDFTEGHAGIGGLFDGSVEGLNVNDYECLVSH